MNKKTRIIFALVSIILVIGFIGCNLFGAEAEALYTMKGGYKSGGSEFTPGIGSSPNSALVPYLVQDRVYTLKLSEVESTLRTNNFNESEILSVRNNLKSYDSAFIYYRNTSNAYRWFWITKN